MASSLREPTDLALDGTAEMASSHVQWTSEDPGTISRVRVDGMRLAKLVTGVPEAESVAVDPSEDRISWTAGTPLERARLDGAGLATIFSDLPLPEGVAVDP